MATPNCVWVVLQTGIEYGRTTIAGVYSSSAVAHQVLRELELDASRSSGQWKFRVSCEPVLANA